MSDKGKRLALLAAVLLILAVGGVYLATGFCFSHDWAAANCEAPVTCRECGRTRGEPLGHRWQEATCTVPRTCGLCAVTEGDLGPHSYQAASCAAPQTCTVCGHEEGDPLPHSWQEASCTAPRTCTLCAATEGEPAPHDYDWTVTQEPGFGREGAREGVCRVCGNAGAEAVPALVPEYAWDQSVVLELPEGAVTIALQSGEEWFALEIRCDAMDSTRLMEIMVQSAADWGIDRKALYEKMSAILAGAADFWTEGDLACCAMADDWKDWTLKINMEEGGAGLIRLETNALEDFRAVTGLEGLE